MEKEKEDDRALRIRGTASKVLKRSPANPTETLSGKGLVKELTVIAACHQVSLRSSCSR